MEGNGKGKRHQQHCSEAKPNIDVVERTSLCCGSLKNPVWPQRIGAILPELFTLVDEQSQERRITPWEEEASAPANGLVFTGLGSPDKLFNQLLLMRTNTKRRKRVSKCAWLVFQGFELGCGAAAFSLSTTGSFSKGCKQKGLIPAIPVACGNPAVVQDMFQIYGVAVPLASERAGTC